jgi:hypothetical protein
MRITMYLKLARRTVYRAATAALLAAALASGTAAAHSITVTPNGNGDGFGPRQISKAWAQAHCHAASPGHIAESSGGVVQFLPAGALACPAFPNPGGQVHP